MELKNLNYHPAPLAWRSDRIVTFALAHRWRAFLGTVKDTLALWMRRARQRDELRRLIEYDDHLLRDLGIPRASVYHEATKRFWQV